MPREITGLTVAILIGEWIYPALLHFVGLYCPRFEMTTRIIPGRMYARKNRCSRNGTRVVSTQNLVLGNRSRWSHFAPIRVRSAGQRATTPCRLVHTPVSTTRRGRRGNPLPDRTPGTLQIRIQAASTSTGRPIASPIHAFRLRRFLPTPYWPPLIVQAVRRLIHTLSCRL